MGPLKFSIDRDPHSPIVCSPFLTLDFWSSDRPNFIVPSGLFYLPGASLLYDPPTPLAVFRILWFLRHPGLCWDSIQLFNFTSRRSRVPFFVIHCSNPVAAQSSCVSNVEVCSPLPYTSGPIHPTLSNFLNFVVYLALRLISLPTLGLALTPDAFSIYCSPQSPDPPVCSNSNFVVPTPTLCDSSIPNFNTVLPTLPRWAVNSTWNSIQLNLTF